MRIERISFSSAGTGTKKTTKNPSNQENTSQNISHNNNSKYIIGGLVGVAALTGIVITGRKGYLGTKIQKLFGNGEKNIKNTTKIENKVNAGTKIVNEAPKLRQETNDIIKDGKKVGIEIKDYKNDNLICTTTKTFDESGNVIAINEKYAGVRKVEVKKDTVNHNNHNYTLWRYFEIPEKGSSKSINFKFDDNNDYSYDLICVYPDEIEAIKQKLIDVGVKFGKSLTDYPFK